MAKPHIRPPLWNETNAATATGGEAKGVWSAHGVSIDSRSVETGDLFIAIKGDRMDGHAFCRDALDRGAAAVVVEHGFDGVSPDAPALRVNDTLNAMEALGRMARSRINGKVVGVTGSVGKTGTKEALARVLSDQGKTHATLGNLNNHWGLPLTLSRMPSDTDHAVIEMGMSHANEIRPLAKMTRPHVAVITAVAPVHIEFFNSVAGIADAKAEIFDGLEPGGGAILPLENPYFDRLLDRAKTAGAERIVAFGEGKEADARLLSCRPSSKGSRVEADILGQRVSFELCAAGRHQAINAMAALGAVNAVGADIERAARTFESIRPTPGRGDRHRVNTGLETFTLIDESYNASPVAVEAALAVLSAMPIQSPGRRIAVLGDMLELGEKSKSLHQGLAETLAENKIDLVFTAGLRMSHLFDAIPREMRGGHAMTAEKLAPLVTAAVNDEDIVLVKGSYGSKMVYVVNALFALASDGNGNGSGKSAHQAMGC